MKSFISLVLVLSISFNEANAQNLGINSTGAIPNTSAGLDVDFNNKGILIPRVALSSLNDAVTIPNPATSLFVYSSGGSVADGYYYNSGTPGAPIWTSFVTSANNGCFSNWQLFTANGSFTVPAGVTKIKVCVYGGGAGGGGGSAAPNYSGGGGGGSGGFAEGIYTVTPGASFTVTVGTGGLHGAPAFPGNNGGSTSFGALISASGGQAGITYPLGGSAGMGIGGYLNTSLGNGGNGGTGLSGASYPAMNGTGGGGTAGGTTTVVPVGGGGGGGGFGGGNGGTYGLGVNALANTGAGGGGGAGLGPGGFDGGDGAAGKVIVFW